MPWLVAAVGNLRGSFTFGLAIIVLSRAVLCRAPHSERLSVIRQSALFSFLALGAACLNPTAPKSFW